MKQEPRELITFGKKNLLTQACEFILRKCIVKKGYILINCSKALSKDLRKQSMLS